MERNATKRSCLCLIFGCGEEVKIGVCRAVFLLGRFRARGSAAPQNGFTSRHVCASQDGVIHVIDPDQWKVLNDFQCFFYAFNEPLDNLSQYPEQLFLDTTLTLKMFLTSFMAILNLTDLKTGS